MKNIARQIKKNRLVKKRKKMQKLVAMSLASRQKKEKLFRLYGISAIMVSFIFLFFMLLQIITSGYSAFLITKIKIPISQDGVVSSAASPDADGRKIVNESLRSLFPDVSGFRDLKQVYDLVSINAAREFEQGPVGQEEIWVTASSEADMLFKGHKASTGSKKIEFINSLEKQDRIGLFFNKNFFTSGDSRYPEMAGILGSVLGSIFVIISCMAFALPIGVMAALYLEEFAPRNKFTDFIEVNINNLAAVPSIVFGILGLVVYLHIFGIPRSASLAGGLTLAMIALPIIVISTRTSLRSVPRTIREGALALGASKTQMVFHQVLPLAMPGIMTGFILSVARVMGETAPLLMIGMVAFVVDMPHGFLDAATAIPVQIYLWADSSEVGFVEKTSAAIMVLLFFIMIANVIAAYIRKKFETRW